MPGHPMKHNILYLFAASLLLSFFAFGIVSASAPAGVKYSVPITVTNSQGSATPAPFQQMITVNSLNFSSYEAPNLQNIAFYFSNGTIADSWLESGNSNTATNTIYWVKIPQGIAANGNTVIYMGFFATSNNMFNTQTTGEAPNLSPLYGEYDDGANVFLFYDNFTGTSLNSSKWAVKNVSYYVNNGFFINNSDPACGNHGLSECYGGIWSSSYRVNAPIVIDFYGTLSSTNSVLWSEAGAVNSSDFNNIGMFVQGVSNAEFGQIDTRYAPVASNPNDLVNTNKMSASPVSGPWTVEAFSRTKATFLLDYANAQNINTYTSYSLNFPLAVGIKVGANATGSKPAKAAEITWIRTRNLPPDGIMPSAHIYAPLTTSLTSNSTSITQGQSVHFTNVTAGGVSPYTFTYSVKPNTSVTFTGNNAVFADSGTYSVMLTAKDSLGEIATSNVTITVHPTFTVYGCASGVTQLDIVSDANTLANGPDTSGTWKAAVPTYDGNPRWTADIPGATWIWDNYTVSSPTTNQLVQFKRTFSVPGNVVSANLAIATDNNGTFAMNSRTDPSWVTSTTSYSAATNFNVTGEVINGSNIFTANVLNIGQAGTDAEQNPAGLLYNISICYTPANTLPPASNSISVSAVPASQSITLSNSATFTAHATGGSGNYIYRWYNDTSGTPVTMNGMTGSALTVPGMSVGTFTYYVTAEDAANTLDSATSNKVSLAITQPSTPTGNPGCGSACGGPSAPKVTQTNSCYVVSGFVLNAHTSFVLTGTAFSLENNFIGTTTGGVTVNGNFYQLALNKSASLPGNANYTYSIMLTYVAPGKANDTVQLCYNRVQQPPPSNLPTPTNTLNNTNSSGNGNYFLNLTVKTNKTITVNTSKSGDTVQLFVNGTAVSSGKGHLSYNGLLLPPGFYTVYGYDVNANELTANSLFVSPGIRPLLNFTKECSNYTYNSSSACTTVAQIRSYDNQLSASLYLNGNFIGTTRSTISNTTSQPGVYHYLFTTSGNANYTGESISYNFTISSASFSKPSGSIVTPALLAILLAIIAGIVVASRRRSNRQ